MKRFFVLVLSFLMLANGFAAIAEEDVFTMRRGIAFGDTLDMLVEKAGTEFVETNDGYYKTTEMQDIADIVNVEQHAYFDENGKLTGLTFTSHTYMEDNNRYGGWAGLLAKNNGMGFNKDVYKDLGERLSDKYGKAVKDDKIPAGYALMETYEKFDSYNNIGASKADLEGEFYEWILPNDDGSIVKIECSYIFYNSNSTKPFKLYWDLIWGYTLIDASVVDAVVEAEAAINDDL